MKLTNILLFLYYSLSIAVLWRLTLAEGITFSNKYISIFALSATVIATYWIQKEKKLKLTILQKVLLLVFPIVFVVFTLTDESWIANLVNPMLIGLFLMVINLFWLKDLRLFKNAILFILIIYAYSNLQFEKWQNFNSGNWKEKSIVVSESKKTDSINLKMNLQEYHFYNTDLDTIQIQPQKELTLLVTWDETCAPCKRAFKDLIPMFKTSDYQHVESFFVYSLNSKRFNPQKIKEVYKSQPILHDQNVIATIDDKLLNQIKTYANPTFIVIDNKTNEIIYLAMGYSKTLKESLLDNLHISK